MASIHEAIATIMADIDAVAKNQKNQQQGFKFRGIDDVYNAVHPILARHGVFTIPTVLSERTEERQTNRGGNLIYRILTIKYTFYSSDGSSLDATVIGEGMDSGDKAASKAMAIGHKYALLQALCIPTEDMVDPDSECQESSRPATNAFANKDKKLSQPNKKQESLEEVKAKVEDIFDAKKVAKPIPRKMFNIKLGWNNILRLCDGDIDFAKGIFEQYGADSSDKITFDIYMKVFNSITGVNSELGSESFIDDNIPFGIPEEATA
jgi:hypothetical protein